PTRGIESISWTIAVPATKPVLAPTTHRDGRAKSKEVPAKRPDPTNSPRHDAQYHKSVRPLSDLYVTN
ncbi:MAG TPA: hypothetical protein VFP79_11730, partial [Pseudolabrys sp.]|nr:hypothetical protein [Pseudolabrys sp.]